MSTATDQLPCEYYLTNGVSVTLLQSRKSAVPRGKHMILQFTEDGAGDGSQEPRPFDGQEAGDLLVLARTIAEEMAVRDDKGKPLYQIAFNSTGMVKRPHFHIHIILPAQKSDRPRLVDPTIAIKDMPDYIIDALKAFEDNQ